MNGPGPIKQAISNAKARKEEKKRATEQGYTYNRNIIHDVGQDKSRNIKGSVGAAAQSKLNQAKQDVKKVSSSVKKAVESKVDKMQESRQARKAMNTADERGKSNRVKTSESSNIKGKWAMEGLKDLLKKGSSAPKKGSSKSRAVKQQAKRSMKNRVS